MVMQNPSMPTTFGLGPAPFTREGNAMRFTNSNSYGLGADRDFDAQAFLNSERCLELRYLKSFFTCQQHDSKLHDANGCAIVPGPAYRRSALAAAQSPVMFVPHMMRRPSSPVRLLRTIVKRFTALVFGKNRWPSFRVSGDPKSQDFTEALAKAEKLHMTMTKGRNKGGSCGTVGFSWRFYDGKPRVLAHDAGLLHVHSWLDREELKPEHVTQVYKFVQNEWDPERQEFGPVVYWHRRDWTTEADVLYRPQRDRGENPTWIVDEEQSVEHRDGFCHFTWVPNTPPDDESEIDGEPDYAGTDESSLSLDAVNSVSVMGALRNLDPTLVLKIDKRVLAAGGVVQKGSDNAINVGPDGAAGYMELAGTSIEAGQKLVNAQRKFILESSECVVPDPDELTAAGMSSVAIEELFSSMTSQADVLRVQYGGGIEDILEQQIASYKRTTNFGGASGKPAASEVIDDDEFEEVEVDDDSELEPENDEEVQHVLMLPPRVVEEELLDENGNPTGEVSITMIEREVGEGGDVELEWPPYFRPSPQEVLAKVQSLVQANGGKPVVSHKTSVEQFALGTGIDPAEEWKRITEQLAAEQQQQAGMFPGAGGEVGALDQLPAGAKPSTPLLTRTHAASIVTVNEARGSMGLEHLDDGDEPLDVYKAKKAEAEKAKQQPDAAQQVGDDKAQAEAKLLQQKAQTEQMPLNKGDIPAIITVDEARARLGYPPMGPPNGSLTVAQWKALQVASGDAIGKAHADALTEGIAGSDEPGADHSPDGQAPQGAPTPSGGAQPGTPAA